MCLIFLFGKGNLLWNMGLCVYVKFLLIPSVRMYDTLKWKFYIRKMINPSQRHYTGLEYARSPLCQGRCASSSVLRFSKLCRYYVFNKFKVCGNSAPSEHIGVTFPTARHSSLCSDPQSCSGLSPSHLPWHLRVTGVHWELWCRSACSAFVLFFKT